MSKAYSGRRGPDGRAVVTVLGDDYQFTGHQHPLDPRNDLYNHSPDGFEWGYHGSGPAQLALAITADLLRNDQRALGHYQAVKYAFIAPLNRTDDWVIREEALREFIADRESEVDLTWDSSIGLQND